MATLLSLCQDVLKEIGTYEIPDTIVGNENETAKQLSVIANTQGISLMRAGVDWQELVKEHSFTTVTSQATYALPTDLRNIISMTFWDSTNNWEMIGQVSEPKWQEIQNNVIASGIRKFFKVSGNLLHIFPIPTNSTDIIKYSYVSNSWCTSSTGTAQNKFLADGDILVLDEQLMKLGIKWRFLREKALSYDTAVAEYQAELKNMINRNTPVSNINLNPQSVELFANVPETGYGV